ncbi:hypothetical protein AVDCRST_MAG92-1031 [uncultured Coleofasciculus sp.]|uniref:Uncharacterized protein n=1 Tax=uncultured Coleofasciculus sp. TaxID=1267456 RepID=A0A6J4HQG0_9CYAN|nr:hypothetical protein AVDCRST_MAG92-1031 [uncultured Coleofasciculus sp.]
MLGSLVFLSTTFFFFGIRRLVLSVHWYWQPVKARQKFKPN